MQRRKQYHAVGYLLSTMSVERRRMFWKMRVHIKSWACYSHAYQPKYVEYERSTDVNPIKKIV